MEVIEAIKTRRSTRAYIDKPVPRETLARILEVARLAPSALNAQPWHFIVAENKETRKAFSKRFFARFLAESPTVIVALGEKNRKFHQVDVSIALTHILLAATAEGLGTCWIGDFDEATIRSTCKIPEKYSVISLLAIGYPREKPDISAKIIKSTKRKKLEDIISQETYGNRINLTAQ